MSLCKLNLLKMKKSEDKAVGLPNYFKKNWGSFNYFSDCGNVYPKRIKL